MSTSSDVRDIEVNVVSSPESSSRNASPEPDSYRIINRHSPSQTSISCYPIIKTSDDDVVVRDNNDKNNSDNNIIISSPTLKTSSCSGSTNFSISSILSRNEPVAKKNCFQIGVQNATQNILESAIGAGCTDTAMLSR